MLMPDTVGYKFDRYMIRWEAAAAELWSLLGSPSLTKVHQQMAVQCPREENRLAHAPRSTSIAAEAKRLAHNGHYKAALALCLRSACGGLGRNTKKDFDTYEAATWAVWRLRARRKYVPVSRAVTRLM
jgi:anti-sigma factor RsiW